MQLGPRLQAELNFQDRHVSLVEQGIDVAIPMGSLAESTLGGSYQGVNTWMMVAPNAYLSAHHLPAILVDLSEHQAFVYSTVQADARWYFTGADGHVQTVRVKGPLRSNNFRPCWLRPDRAWAWLYWHCTRRTSRSAAAH